MKELKILALVVLISAFSFPQSASLPITNTVHFTADISGILGVGIGGAFDPLRDSLLVIGLDWDGETTVIGNRMMSNVDTLNPGIYTTTLLVSSTLDSVRWKFKAAPYYIMDNAGWETGPDRWLTFSNDSNVVNLPIIIPNIYPNITTPTLGAHLVIILTLTDAINRYNGLPIPINEIEFVGIKGNVDYLGSLTEGCWCADDTLNGNMKLLKRGIGNTWNIYHEFPVGTLTDTINYQFSIMYPGADTINGGITPLANEFPASINHNYVFSTENVMFVNNAFGNLNPVGIERINNFLPSELLLEQNYPNPFNPTTKIRYSIPENRFVTLKVFNLLGEEIEALVNNEQAAGVYEATFDASKLSSGIYFYTLQTDNFSSTKKMVIIK